jgi:hypothetical protein
MGYLLFFFLKRFKQTKYTPKTFGAIVGYLFGGVLLTFLAASGNALRFYPIGLVVGSAAWILLVIFTNLRGNGPGPPNGSGGPAGSKAHVELGAGRPAAWRKIGSLITSPIRLVKEIHAQAEKNEREAARVQAEIAGKRKREQEALRLGREEEARQQEGERRARRKYGRGYGGGA